MSPVATETPTPGWGLGPTPAYTVIYTGKLHHDRGRYPLFRMEQALLRHFDGRRHRDNVEIVSPLTVNELDRAWIDYLVTLRRA